MTGVCYNKNISHGTRSSSLGPPGGIDPTIHHTMSRCSTTDQSPATLLKRYPPAREIIKKKEHVRTHAHTHKINSNKMFIEVYYMHVFIKAGCVTDSPQCRVKLVRCPLPYVRKKS